MTKDDLLKCIAQAGYNVGFGAKKHFATYDIVLKVPGIIAIVSLVVGIFGLVFDLLSTKYLSASFIVLGIVGIFISLYEHKKQSYENTGKQLTDIFNSLKTLYYNTKAAQDQSLVEYEKQLEQYQKEAQATCISQQILFSDWYAHYKFFWQDQIDWIEEQKQFRFFRDKLPLTFSFVSVLFLLVAVGLLVFYFSGAK